LTACESIFANRIIDGLAGIEWIVAALDSGAANSQEAGMTRESLSAVADAVSIVTGVALLIDVLSRWL
jgi:hypothetical protein